MVVRGAEEAFRESHPSTAELVVEVAVNSLGRDQRKAAIYASAGVPEYWIVDPNAASIIIHRSPKDGQYLEITAKTGETLVSTAALSALQVKPAAVFV